MKAIYEISVFGNCGAFSSEIEGAISAHLAEFSLGLGHEVALDVGGTVLAPNPKAATVGLFFGGTPVPAFDRPVAVSNTDPIIPIVSDLARCPNELPIKAADFNAMEMGGVSAAQEIAAATAECLGLLPARRRLFISYRRAEATPVALQLFEALSKKQFDVYLDTHEVRPGTVFQHELMHSLSGCDLLLMLDTKTYVTGHWTKVELVAANTLHTAVLRLGWPDVDADSAFTYSDQVQLGTAEFAPDQTLPESRIEQIAQILERLRSKSVAIRQAKLIGTLRSAASNLNGRLSHPGLMRRVKCTFPGGKALQVYPIVEIPTAEHVHRIVENAENSTCALLYDHLGVMQKWQDHLSWLGKQVDDFHWIRAGHVYNDLVEALK